MRLLWVLPIVLLASCQSDQDVAVTRAKRDAAQDQQCKSWGAKPGTPEYVHCRETLFTQSENNRRQLAAAYLMSQPIGSAPVTTYVPPRTVVNCSSVQSGAITSTNCY